MVRLRYLALIVMKLGPLSRDPWRGVMAGGARLPKGDRRTVGQIKTLVVHHSPLRASCLPRSKDTPLRLWPTSPRYRYWESPQSAGVLTIKVHFEPRRISKPFLPAERATTAADSVPRRAGVFLPSVARRLLPKAAACFGGNSSNWQCARHGFVTLT